MGVRKCPKCGSVWYTALVNCAFCGIEGEEVKGPISPAKLNLGRKGVEAGPAPGPDASERDAPAGGKEPADPPKVEAPPPPPPPPKEIPVVPAKVELPPLKVEEPAPERKPEPILPPRPERIPSLRPAARVEVTAPAPRIPSATVPLVFGVLGLVAAALLPAASAVRHDKIQVTLALLAWAILAPFAPFAWFTAQRYTDFCRALGFSPAPSANTGRVLGMLASFLLVFEFSALAVFVVVQILSGKVVCPLWK